MTQFVSYCKPWRRRKLSWGYCMGTPSRLPPVFCFSQWKQPWVVELAPSAPSWVHGSDLCPSIPHLCLDQRSRLTLLSYIHSNSPALDSLTICGSSLGTWFQSVCMIIIWCIICSSIELEALSVQGLCWIDFSALCRAKHGTRLMLGGFGLT